MIIITIFFKDIHIVVYLYSNCHNRS